MAEPLVSVIVPVYNAGPYLVNCIKSIQEQRYKNLEIFLVDDDSKDVSPLICDMYARNDSRIRVIRKQNSGVSATRNLAIDMASGEYLQFVDSDDWIDENATRLMVERAQETGADLVISHYCRVHDEKVSVHGFLRQSGVLTQKELARQLLDEPASFYYGVMWNKLYRRSIIDEHRIRCNEELMWSEDFLFNLEYIRYAKSFCALKTPVYYYRKNENSIVSSQLNLVKVVKTKANLFPYYKQLYTDIGLYEQYKAQIYKYLVSIAEA
ncbi:glycosyltransferase family 2 protein [Bacilliculturomica massiliensis]|uniref:glycosyltransferase family 2 protein n=1 Tax=Bacilliculturomica massiliensis TaxID=1917867 RepID=UPI001031AC37|nr:glycosyltransferase family 2 protein [Bacilliculturomica massiliensis]